MLKFYGIDLLQKCLTFLLLFAEGSKKELKEGVLPTLNLPTKLIKSTVDSSNKRIPTVREFIPKTYATNLGDIKKQLKHYTKPGWKLRDSSDNEICFKKMLKSVHQPQYEVSIDHLLKLTIWYFGWIVSSTVAEQFNITTNTITQFLNELESRQLCAGLNLDKGEDTTGVGQKHIITKSAVKEDKNFPYLEVKILAYRYDYKYNIHIFYI